ncbi:MAG: hypothetical protein JW779_01145, partial [Candidatus Thorarchaeota archaeon]|nr:hypothetical protein [Candidatus Thorarchaeota archaeon]
ELANALREKYPDAKDIRQLQEEIEIRLLLEKLFKIKVRNTRIRNVISASIIIFMIILIGYLIYSSFANFRQTLSEQLTNNQQEIQTQQETAIESLVLQAQTLLDSQNLTLARDIIEEIEQLNPEDQSIPSLRATESYISELDELYTEAQAEQTEGNLDQALTLYEQIAGEFPNFRDVNLQITAIEQQLLIQEKLQLAQEAYQNQVWATVILEYEGAIALDNSLLDDNIKSELVNSYIKSIVQLIDKEDTTIDDIELAETYYKRSLALIPQSKAFEDERKTLDTLILNLLVVKYLEYADTLIDQKPFDEASIKVALKYLNSAYRLNPENTSLENEVKKTEYYYTGVQNFYGLDWSQCISTLELLREMDSEFGNQVASYLLYEAYMAYGTQRASYGLYLDAKHNFEEAEFLVWDQIGTPTRIFYTQLEIAYSAGKSHSYE